MRHSLPYLAKTFGSVPAAPRNIIGVEGLFFFIVGYALVRNDLPRLQLARGQNLPRKYQAQNIPRRRAMLRGLAE